MHESIADIRELQRRLEALDRLIRRLDPGVRAALAELLAPHAPPAATGAERPAPVSPPVVPAAGGRPLTPGDGVLYCTAMLLAERGAGAVTADAIRARAERLGLRVPRDPLRTLRLAREDGRPLFRFEDGRWRPTATGAALLRSQFGVRVPVAGNPRGRGSRAR